MKAQHGVSLLELLVGMTIGLLLLLAVSGLLVGLLESQARERRQAQLGEMLDGALSLMAMELRRAGYWNGSGDPAANPYGRIYIEQNGRCLRYGYDTPPGGKPGLPRHFAFRLSRDGAGRGEIQRLEAEPADWRCDADDARWNNLSQAGIGDVQSLRFSRNADGGAIELEVAARTQAGAADERVDIHALVTLRNRPTVESPP
ncbi:PulJ/GspJ family protein [Chromobacterium sp. CV08]|uniref:PulJ/GspJ family protein n=1 Tax=Chromobacterium sp. CV08 TaxID=3133274 RepID=UPI003DAA448E